MTPDQNPVLFEKVIFIPYIGNFGGGERIYLSLSHYLYKRSIPHKIVSYEQRIDLNKYADWPVPVEQIAPGKSSAHRISALYNYIRTRTSEGLNLPHFVGIQAALHAGLLKLPPYTLMMLDTPSLLTPPAREVRGVQKTISNARAAISHIIVRRGVRLAKSVVTTTCYQANEVKRLYGIEPTVSYLGVAVPNSSPRCRRTEISSLRLLSVSRLETSKRIDWIIKSLSSFEQENPTLSSRVSLYFDIVGEGSCNEQLHADVQTAGLENRVVFHGHVNDKQLEKIYMNSDLFIMPAIQGYGLPALEALGRHIPVVMHRESGVSEVLSNSSWVEIFSGGPESLKMSIITMIKRILSGELFNEPIPKFPSEDDWAENITQICGWMRPENFTGSNKASGPAS